jgi:endonuclease-3
MATNRSAMLNKLHKVLKKRFKPYAPNLRLPVLEQLVFACCLEDSQEQDAQRAFNAVEEQFFDWNEVRVSSAKELSEVMQMLSFPREAALRLKKTLQSVFEANYSFDLDKLKKENLGVASKKLNKYEGVTPFAVAFVTQTALGGHAIPVSRGALEALYILGTINEKEKKSYNIPGMERAIPKSKGIEFGSLLNQLGCQLRRSPYGTATRKILLDIAPDAKERLPKRIDKKALARKEAEAAKEAARKEAAAKKEKAAAAKKAAKAAKARAAPSRTKSKPAKKTVTTKKKKAAVTRKKKVKKKTAARVKKKKVVKKKKKTASKRVARRKPR